VNPPIYGETMGLSGAIGDAGLHECLCPDVYRALARMGGGKGPDCRAVLVCVDRMDAEQFTFFELVSRRFSSLPVFVYARSSAQEKIERAIGLGGIRIGDAELLTSALSIYAGLSEPIREDSEPPAPEMQHQEPSLQSSDPKPLPNDPTNDESCESADQFEAIETADQELEPAVDEEEEGVARVPWLQYEDNPRRIPPSRSRFHEVDPQPGRSPLSDESSKRMSEPAPPLLSAEELQALIGKPNDPLDHGLDEPEVRGS